MDAVKYPALGIVDMLVLIFHIVVQILRDVPLSIILKSGIILLLYLPLMPFEIAYDLQCENTPVDMNLLQRAIFKLVRLAFASFDYRIGRVFFSESASLPFIKRRLGGISAFKDHCAAVDTTVEGRQLKGWWLAPSGHAQHLAEGRWPPRDAEEKQWTLCYFHGGGFVMGSPTFYLEFLHKLRQTLAQSNSMRNVAIFAVEYPLAPEASHSARAEAARRAWMYLAKHPAVDPTKMIVSGDSAGGNIALGLRMAIGVSGTKVCRGLPAPAQMILLSPFTSLSEPTNQFSSLHYNEPYDFVNASSLNTFAQLASGVRTSLYRSNIIEFIGSKVTRILSPIFSIVPRKLLVSSALIVDHLNGKDLVRHNSYCRQNYLLSPGDHLYLLDVASTSCPILVLYGKGEILADQSRAIGVLGDGKTPRHGVELIERRTVHAWPMVMFNLGMDEEERAFGLREISRWITAHERMEK